MPPRDTKSVRFGPDAYQFIARLQHEAEGRRLRKGHVRWKLALEEVAGAIVAHVMSIKDGERVILERLERQQEEAADSRTPARSRRSRSKAEGR